VRAAGLEGNRTADFGEDREGVRIPFELDLVRLHDAPLSTSIEYCWVQRRQVRVSLAWPLDEVLVDALLETLNARLNEWNPQTAAEVRERVREIIDLADHDALDLLRSLAAEQEVLDMLDETAS